MLPFRLQRVLPLALCSLPALSAGCASNAAYERTLDQKESEIRDLRAETAALKEERDGLLSEIDSLNVALRGAQGGAPAAAAPASAPAEKSFPELDDLGIGYGVRDGHMVISIPSSITFDSGKAEISKEGQRALKQVAQTLAREYPSAKYQIEGHTDTDPIKKSKFASNRELSVARAMAVLSYLVEECGVEDKRCVVVGHGQYLPLGPNSDAKAKAQNRRVEIVVLSPRG
jgi:chemotaxis protein MotB